MSASTADGDLRKQFSMTVLKKKGYLHFVVTGENTPEVVRAYFGEIYTICKKRKCRAVLVEENLRGPGLSIIEMFRIASETGQTHMDFYSRIAYVDINPQHSHENLKFGETVATNRGLGMRLFTDLEEAEEWMKEPPSPRRGVVAP